jgi:DNA mismatch repair protein MutS
LTRLEEEKPGVVNLNVAVHENGEGIVFLHKILKGAADKSYGIHVAKLAGLPQPVIKRARELLAKLEKGEPSPSKEKNSRQKQLELFVPQPAPHPILEELKVLDLNQMTPLDIFRKVAQWQAQDVL